jgi:hypothetical protein
MTKTPVPINSVVTHLSKYGMKKQAGLVVADAGTKYGRQYVWVSWVAPKTLVVMQTAFWTQVLRVSDQTAQEFIKQTAKSMSYAENRA